eukprot:365688-Chlamydomonas_euryale.AAC.16
MLLTVWEKLNAAAAGARHVHTRCRFLPNPPSPVDGRAAANAHHGPRVSQRLMGYRARCVGVDSIQLCACRKLRKARQGGSTAILTKIRPLMRACVRIRSSPTRC